VRPRGEAVLKPRDNMITEGQTNGRWPSGAIPRWKQGVARGRAEPAPPRGGYPGSDSLAGENRDNAERGFLGGMRSARPRGEAVCVPRHNIFMGGKRSPVA